MMRALRDWLLRRLAGKDVVIINATIDAGAVIVPHGSRLIASNFRSANNDKSVLFAGEVG